LSLDAGTRFGAYEVLDAIGSGGMGEVYRAHDTKLNRDVALKVLLPTLASDPDRLSRFSREAQLLASLNHPNIAHIYGIEETAGVIALVMELVDGPTLADRIAHGAMPLAGALAIAGQIADALQAAHEQGIVHRDLKPANIKIRRDGTVKVLDFGLAKAIEPTSSARAAATMSPTLSIHATQAGLILGTAAYMSPEQAAGGIVDKRSDLWAFGVLLIEMIIGRPVFDGESVSHVLASVLKSEPDWSALPADTPAAIRRLLRRCLEKDRKRRLDSAADARIEIDEALTPQPDHSRPHERARDRRVAPILTALLSVAVLASAVTWAVVRPKPGPPARPMRFAIVPPPSQPLEMITGDRSVALAADGGRLVYVTGNIGQPQLLLRAIDQLDATPIRGTVGGRAPFISPDGRWVAFFAVSQLKRVPIGGGPSVTLCRTNGGSRGAAWLPDDTIVFATSDTGAGLLRVSAAGGEPQVLTRPDPSKGEQDHVFPFALPDGRGVLFTITPNGPIENAQVAVLDLKTGQTKTLIRGGTSPAYVETGHLIYAVAGTVQAVRFDINKLEVTSDPVLVVDHVRSNNLGAAEFAISRNGTLVYAPGTGAAAQAAAARQLVWVDRKGYEEPIKAPSRAYFYPRLSPDGKRLAVDTRDQDLDVWILDFAAQPLQRFTFDPANDWFPVWTPDGKRIAFASGRTGTMNLFWQPSDGSGRAERLTTSPSIQWPYSFTPDGKSLVYLDQAPKSGFDLRLLHLDTMRSEALLETTATESNGEVSPDGRFLAYQSNETNQDEIFVRPFPNVGAGVWQISSEGGSRPVWSRNGRELFYLDSNGLLTAVQVQTTPSFTRGAATKLLETRYFVANTGRPYDVSPDGQRFLMVKDTAPDSNTTPASLVVVVNWVEELKKLVPTTNDR
jgi:eukaryotic-like serine/threonine-protein kinase